MTNSDMYLNLSFGGRHKHTIPVLRRGGFLIMSAAPGHGQGGTVIRAELQGPVEKSQGFLPVLGAIRLVSGGVTAYDLFLRFIQRRVRSGQQFVDNDTLLLAHDPHRVNLSQME